MLSLLKASDHLDSMRLGACSIGHYINHTHPRGLRSLWCYGALDDIHLISGEKALSNGGWCVCVSHVRSQKKRGF